MSPLYTYIYTHIYIYTHTHIYSISDLSLSGGDRTQLIPPQGGDRASGSSMERCHHYIHVYIYIYIYTHIHIYTLYLTLSLSGGDRTQLIPQQGGDWASGSSMERCHHYIHVYIYTHTHIYSISDPFPPRWGPDAADPPTGR